MSLGGLSDELTQVVRHGGRRASDALRAAARDAGPAELADLVALRHRGYLEAPHPGPAVTWPPSSDTSLGAGVPEVDATALDVDVLASALGQRGCLLVRNLIGPEVAASLVEDIRRAFAAFDAHGAGAPVEETAPWYVPFAPEPPYSFGGIERAFTRQLGGVLSVESPASLAHLAAVFADVGMGPLLEAYFGEWPALSVKKSTLRWARPDSPTEWHQDGAFLGRDTRSVNVWLSLSDCGVDAPGIDVIPHAFAEIVTTGSDDARFAWSVSVDAAGAVAAPPVERPRFGPGDALLFDQLTLHRTGVEPTMTADRFAIESWFFAPSTYPHEQVPLLF